MFEFYFNTKVFYGANSCISAILTILKNESWSKIGIVIDYNVSKTEGVNELVIAIRNNCDKTIIDYCPISEPTYDFLDKVRTTFEDQDLQAVVGIGGGSSLDIAKAIAVLVNNRDPAISYRGFNKMTETVLPVVAIPTTAGTGSEVTPNASFVDTIEKRKMGINGEAVRPRYAILDPVLTLSCPERPTISAGVDSIVHAVEAYTAKKTNPLARMFAKEGLRYVLPNLPLVLKEPQNIKYRERVMNGAFLSGIALMNSGTGPAAAMSYPLGVHFKVPHGIAGGIFLPHVIRHNIEQGYYQYADIYECMTNSDADHKSNDHEKARLFLEKMLAIWKVLSIPDDLTKLGLKADFMPQFIRETMELKGALDQNPVPFYEDRIVSILKRLKVT